MDAPVHHDVLEAVGRTPLIRLNRLSERTGMEMWGKCEFLNPGGAVKDRIGVRMLLEAEKSGKIQPGDILVEPTSGNTGVGIALAAAVRGYKVVIVLPVKMSMEKQVVLEALGAQIVRVRSDVAFDHPESLFGIARQIVEQTPRAFMLDQYINAGNPDAHYEGTGHEIAEQVQFKLDFFVCGTGTGGTITGAGRKLKELIPNVQVIGADPVGSILGGGEAGTYQVEGIGYDFFPDVFDPSIVDRWVKTDDQTSFTEARRLIREEGLLIGGSTGSALQAAIEVSKDAKPGSKFVVLLPDGIRNYLGKFANDQWLSEKGFTPPDKPHYVDFPSVPMPKP